MAGLLSVALCEEKCEENDVSASHSPARSF